MQHYVWENIVYSPTLQKPSGASISTATPGKVLIWATHWFVGSNAALDQNYLYRQWVSGLWLSASGVAEAL